MYAILFGMQLLCIDISCGAHVATSPMGVFFRIHLSLTDVWL